MLSKDSETGQIELRHYAIETKMVDVSKGVKRLASIKTELTEPFLTLQKPTIFLNLLLIHTLPQDIHQNQRLKTMHWSRLSTENVLESEPKMLHS